MNEKLRDAQTDALFDAILGLTSREDCYRFFDDLCTISELRAMTQRYEVARLLSEGRIYADIAERTGASTATISRVNRCLVYGSDGYKDALARSKRNE
ncbi:MAG: TrpR-like protein, YerC/YecD [Clostridiales bacterium]|nr:TrpR-like protein, YerC/YecD [Clostridiales bacterium]